MTLIITVSASQSAISTLSPYPSYSPGLEIQGSIRVEQKDATRLTVTYNITGAAPSLTAGLHIHAGTSCDTAAAVLGHYYRAATIPKDPWTTTYTADVAGVATGSFDMTCGYDLLEVSSHAVVVHGASIAESSTRVACGLLHLDSDERAEVSDANVGAWAVWLGVALSFLSSFFNAAG